MPNNTTTPFQPSDNAQGPQAGVVTTSAAYTVGANDNYIQLTGNTVLITLAATSNSPVYVDPNSHTAITLTDGTRTYQLGTSGYTAMCVKIGGAGNQWAVIGPPLA